ncbi:TPA: hypothetical protein ACGP6J_004055 [Escherichia coli]|uniref:hypothetical protein n=1 Tax=Escherichia coli TaxID=562 RepID=UPI00131F09E3|nr:hypothetical protein [Escherichia coli]EFE3851715.1 hypothetical protein [Escherichia coli]EFK9173863.1 hypothetical protein [Escherichia coli]EKH2380694.1 hypothetical protein [Escherichia coli]MCN2413880.1 hypothetical protein [Escherichia coli]HAH2300739.1 hypothetical protein [Escherichia coli]
MFYLIVVVLSGGTGRDPDQMAVVIAPGVTVLQLYIQPARYVFYSPERWQSIGIFPPPSPSQERTVSRRSRETSKFASLKNSEMIFGNKETPGTRLDAFLTCSDAIWKHRGATRCHIPIDRARHTRTSRSCGLQEIPFLILYGGA